MTNFEMNQSNKNNDWASSNWANPPPGPPPPAGETSFQNGDRKNESWYNFNNQWQPGEGWVQANFDSPKIRQRFIKKVLGILAVQLTMTFGLTLFSAVMASQDKLQLGEGLYSFPLIWFSLVMTLVLLLGAMCCCGAVLRKVPYNFVWLFLFTIFESHLISTVAFRYDLKTINLALGITAGIVGLVAILAACTSYDFTKLLPMMCVVLLGWMLVIMVSRIVGLAWDRTLYGVIGVSIFTVFLLIDLKMMMGGGAYEFSEDDYVMAAINIYLDIINIFLHVLAAMEEN